MILVTGGAGYIGSHFIKAYLDQNPGVEVAVVDNLSEGHSEALSFSKQIHLIQEDIGHLEGIKAVFQRYPIDAVVHFAASCYVGESQENPSKYFRNNVINSLTLFEAMALSGVRKVVFSSSCASYGNPMKETLDENHPQNPINVYGQTKWMIEQALASYAETLGWSYIALRYFNAAGADESGLLGERHDPETHLIPLVLKAAMGKLPGVKIYGDDYETRDGTCIRDYIHVNDLALAHCQALSRLKTQQGGEAINLGTRYGASVKEIVAMCQEVTGRQIEVKNAPRRDGDPPVLVANAEKAKQLLGWQPQYNLQRILQTAWDWEQNPRY